MVSSNLVVLLTDVVEKGDAQMNRHPAIGFSHCRPSTEWRCNLNLFYREKWIHKPQGKPIKKACCMCIRSEKGKNPVVQEDPIIEAVRTLIMGGGPVILEGGDSQILRNQSFGQQKVGAGQLPPRVHGLVRTKHEFWEKYPGKLGLHIDEPIGSDVLGFDDGMRRCSSVEKEEAKLFRGLPERFRVIPDFILGLQEELMEAERSSDLDFVYIATMITEEHTGVRIEAAKKIMLLLKKMDSWDVYAVNIQKKILIVMDPVETEERQHEREAKHKGNTIRVLSNLRCIHECILKTSISSEGCGLKLNTGMHTCCGRLIVADRGNNIRLMLLETRLISVMPNQGRDLDLWDARGRRFRVCWIVTYLAKSLVLHN